MIDRRKNTKGQVPGKGTGRRADEAYCFSLFDDLPTEEGASGLDQKLAARKNKTGGVAEALSKGTKDDRGES